MILYRTIATAICGVCGKVAEVSLMDGAPPHRLEFLRLLRLRGWRGGATRTHCPDCPPPLLREDARTEAWREVVRLRDEERKTFKEIGAAMGFSRARAHQIYFAHAGKETS